MSNEAPTLTTLLPVPRNKATMLQLVAIICQRDGPEAALAAMADAQKAIRLTDNSYLPAAERTAAGRIWTELAVRMCNAVTEGNVDRAIMLAPLRRELEFEFPEDIQAEKIWWGIKDGEGASSSG